MPEHLRDVKRGRGGAVSKLQASASPARLAAAEVLSAVNRKQGHSDDLLHSSLLAKLSQEDRNLCTALVLGVLRWQIALDVRIRALLARPDAVVADDVMIALRLGAFQLLHLDRIPPHAAINESVELVRMCGHPRAAGMANAILRKLSVAPTERKPLHESADALAMRLGHPAWLVERWTRSYGRPAAAAICEFDQHEPQGPSLFTQELASEMDDGSRLVAELAAAAVPAAKRIWDCCAAPGGKTLVLSVRHPQAEIVATDLSPKRLQALTERFTHEATERITTKLADASTPDAVEGKFDLILCDVPCSGTGTIARNPEIRHHLQPQDLTRQAKRQRSILGAALAHLAPQGRLIYSTCSLEAEECEDVVDAVLKDNPGYVRVSVAAVISGLLSQGLVAAESGVDRCVIDGALRTLPGFNFQADGFFAVMLARHA